MSTLPSSGKLRSLKTPNHRHTEHGLIEGIAGVGYNALAWHR